MTSTQKLYTDPSDVSAALSALGAASDKSASKKLAVKSLANAAGQTLTTLQMLSGILLRSGAAGVSDTTPTAAALVAALTNAAVGDTVDLLIRNNNTGTLTIVAGSGVTLEGTTTIATVNTRRYALEFTNVTVGSEAVTLHGLEVAAL
jgi:hypothetical protein